jgi:hypothetical protein
VEDFVSEKKLSRNMKEYWTPTNRQRQSVAVRGRKFTPLTPPALPHVITALIAVLATDTISVIGVTGSRNSGGIRYPRDAWTLTATDPNPKDVFTRFQHHANDTGFDILQFVSTVALDGKTTSLMAVVVPASTPEAAKQ